MRQTILVKEPSQEETKNILLKIKKRTKMFAEIIINSNARALNRIFDYIVPTEMENIIKVGARVFVPFGKGSKLEDGFVINLKEESEIAKNEDIKLKDTIERLCDNLVRMSDKEYKIIENNYLEEVKKIISNKS